MKTSDFDYELPDELIAHYPIDSRTASRLLVRLNEIEHRTFQDITNYFDEGDLLINNNTSVIPARIYGNKESCLLYTSPSPRDSMTSRMPSSA